ncbi:MAG: twin-arginine translocation signal domain-containing protein, partial [Ginsengibacter sp.]
MNSRRNFLKTTGALAVGSLLISDLAKAASRKSVKDVGLQLYT